MILCFRVCNGKAYNSNCPLVMVQLTNAALVERRIAAVDGFAGCFSGFATVGHITRSCCPAEAPLTDVVSVEGKIVGVDGSAGQQSCSLGIATRGHITRSCPPAVAPLTDVALVEGQIMAVDGYAGSPSRIRSSTMSLTTLILCQIVLKFMI
jgi:hypothetical protein